RAPDLIEGNESAKDRAVVLVRPRVIDFHVGQPDALLQESMLAGRRELHLLISPEQGRGKSAGDNPGGDEASEPGQSRNSFHVDDSPVGFGFSASVFDGGVTGGAAGVAAGAVAAAAALAAAAAAAAFFFASASAAAF